MAPSWVQRIRTAVERAVVGRRGFEDLKVRTITVRHVDKAMDAVPGVRQQDLSIFLPQRILTAVKDRQHDIHKMVKRYTITCLGSAV